MVVNVGSDLMDFNFSLLGEGSVVLAAFILSAASIYGKRISQTMDTTVMTGYQLAIGGLVLTLGAIYLYLVLVSRLFGAFLLVVMPP